MAKANDNAPAIALEVIDGPLDGLRFGGATELVRLGRSDGAGPDQARNDLVLQRDSYASSFHASITYLDGRWLLRDLGSTNGTWLAGRKMKPNEPAALEEGTVFVAGNSIIRFSTQPAQSPAADPAVEASLSPAARTMLNRARTMARERKAAWVGSTNLFAVLAESDAPPLPEFFEHAGLEPAAAAGLVRKFDLWKGDLGWIARDVLEGRRAHEQAVRSVLPTPRLMTILTLADRARRAGGGEAIEPVHILLGIFREGGCRAARALEEAGYAAAEMAHIIDDMIARQSAPPEEASPRESTVHLAPLRPAPAVPLRKPVDGETWLLARELMDRLQAIQNEFRLAEPAARFEALCNAVREGAAKAPPAKRAALLEQLYYLFPLLEGSIAPPPPSVSEATPPARPAETTDSHAPPPPEPAPAAPRPAPPGPAPHDAGLDTGDLLQKVFGNERMATMNAMGECSQFLQLMQTLYRFALDMERLAKGMVQSLQGGGAGESRYFLPFTAQDLKMMSEKLLNENDPETVGQVRDYLGDLGHWIIALIAAHQKGASEWNHEVWSRINPAAIRNETQVSSLNKVLGVSKADLWQTFERIARDLRPEVTDDLMTERIGRLANDEFRRLGSKK